MKGFSQMPDTSLVEKVLLMAIPIPAPPFPSSQAPYSGLSFPPKGQEFTNTDLESQQAGVEDDFYKLLIGGSIPLPGITLTMSL